jgi:hypothetical protein
MTILRRLLIIGTICHKVFGLLLRLVPTNSHFTDSHGESGVLSRLSDSPTPYILGIRPSNYVSIQVSDHTLASRPSTTTPGSSMMVMSSGSAMSASGPSTSTSGHDLMEMPPGHHVQRTRISVFCSDLSTIQCSLELHALPFSNINLVQCRHILLYHMVTGACTDHHVDAAEFPRPDRSGRHDHIQISDKATIEFLHTQIMQHIISGHCSQNSESCCPDFVPGVGVHVPECADVHDEWWVNQIDPALQVHILSALYGSKISQNSLSHIPSNLEVNHHDSEIVSQLRRKLKGYIIAICNIVAVTCFDHKTPPTTIQLARPISRQQCVRTMQTHISFEPSHRARGRPSFGFVI